MTVAAIALRAAIRAALLADAPLVALLGGPRIYDEPPKDVAFPFVTLGEATTTDASTKTEPADEHALILHAWSRQGGHREAHGVAAAVLEALIDAPLSLDGHRLANLRFATAEVRRADDGRTYHARIRLRALTEPL